MGIGNDTAIILRCDPSYTAYMPLMSKNDRKFPSVPDAFCRGRYDVEWFTTQAPAAASLEPLWTRLTSSLVPVRAVSIPNDPVRATKVLNDIAIARSSSHLFKYAGGQEIGDEEPRGGRGMPLAEYVAELSNFDVVLCANSLEILDAKVRNGGKGYSWGRGAIRVRLQGACSAMLRLTSHRGRLQISSATHSETRIV